MKRVYISIRIKNFYINKKSKLYIETYKDMCDKMVVGSKIAMYLAYGKVLITGTVLKTDGVKNIMLDKWRIRRY